MNPDKRLTPSQKAMLDEMKGIEFLGAEELARFIKGKMSSLPEDQVQQFRMLFSSRIGRGAGVCQPPSWLATFIGEFAKIRNAKAICDPWAGNGSLIGHVNLLCEARSASAFTVNQSEYSLGKILFPEIEWHCVGTHQLLESDFKQYDLIISSLPFGLRHSSPLEVDAGEEGVITLRDDFAHLLMVHTMRQIPETGIGAFIVTPQFFNSTRSVFRHFGLIGLKAEAALTLPQGTFSPYTEISTVLVIITRSESGPMFVGQLSNDQKMNSQILENMTLRKEGGSLEMGRFVEPTTYRGLASIRAEERLKEAEARFGGAAIPLCDLSTSITLGRIDKDFAFEDRENSLYIPLIGSRDVVTSIDELAIKTHNYAQVTIDPSRSSAAFVARFLNSDLGKELRYSNQKGSTIPRLNKESLQYIGVFVPDLKTQQLVLDVEARIAEEQNTMLALQGELSEIRRDLWGNPSSSSDAEKKLAVLSKRLGTGVKEHAAERLDQWFETLPFPMASILRAWQATPSNDYKSKYEHLIDFFEGTAEFLSVILLSAYSSNEPIFTPIKERLNNAMQKQNLTFRRATFGTWKCVSEFLGARTRELLAEKKDPEETANSRDLCAELFSDRSLVLPRMLSRPELSPIFAATNKMRNDWKGHGGLVSPEEARYRNEMLLAELQKLREVFEDVWVETQLIHSQTCTPRRGLFENEVSIQMGSNSEFLKENRSMSIWLDVERLYLYKKGSPGALKLLPLIQVGPSPRSAKNACYFFSRVESDGVRFVSHHYDVESEWKDTFADVTATIESLSQI